MIHKIVGWAVGCSLGLFLLTAPRMPAEAPRRHTENVLFVMTDGLRWQEVFGGADDALLNKARGGVADVEAVRKAFWRDRAEDRRTLLLPFTWEVLAKQGQLYGNRWRGSTARVTNGLNFSYPGYSEILCGFVDPKIDSNAKKNNPHVTVLEWLHQKPAFRGRVAAFTAWDVFPFIFNRERSGLPVNAAQEPLTAIPETPAVRMLNTLMLETVPPTHDCRHDSFTFHAALEYLKVKKPRVLFLSFDETDNYGHAGRYDQLLAAAQKVDGYVRTLWETVQSLPEYRGKTTLIFCPDHGRGDPPVEWKNHGKDVKGSEFTWMGFLGPDTPALGERHDVEAVTQNQIAATLAALLGEDYGAAQPRAGKPIRAVLE
jgi:hypothetical protein